MVLRWPDPTLTLTRAERDALYPLDDDEPMTVSRSHYEALTYAVDATRLHLRDKDCLVAGDFAVYYEPLLPGEAGPGASVAPDLLVAFGVTLDRDTSYCLWEVGKMPELVMEMTSKSTKAIDRTHKHRLYARLGVSEYWMYDPHGSYLDSRLQGWQLVDDIYQPIPGQSRVDLDAEIFPSTVLGTFWGYLWDSGDLRLWDPSEETWYLPQMDTAIDRIHQRRRADTEAQARQAADQRAEAAAQRAEAAARRADTEAQARQAADQRAEAAAQRADTEAQARQAADQRADTEAQARQAAEAEVAWLQARLAALTQER